MWCICIAPQLFRDTSLDHTHFFLIADWPAKIKQMKQGHKNIQPACQCVICKSRKSCAQVSLLFAFSPQHHKERSMAEVIGFVTWRRVSLLFKTSLEYASSIPPYLSTWMMGFLLRWKPKRQTYFPTCDPFLFYHIIICFPAGKSEHGLYKLYT